LQINITINYLAHGFDEKQRDFILKYLKQLDTYNALRHYQLLYRNIC